jgi:negative regulator of flagellin synthesis FlgM
MKLDLMSEIQVGSPPAGATKPAERPAAGGVASGRSVARSSASSGSSVTVTLSSQTQSLVAASGQTDIVDTAKVQAMQQAIANGSFKVNAENIADRLLANAREMLGAARRG